MIDTLAAGLCALADAGGESLSLESLLARMESMQARHERDVSGLQTELSGLRTQVRTQNTTIERLAAQLGSLGSRQTPARRRGQELTCGRQSVTDMLEACCAPNGPGGPGTGGHRRSLQGGCSALPSTCSVACGRYFMPIYESCQRQPLMVDLPAAERVSWTRFYSLCRPPATPQPEPAQSDALQPVEVKMFRLFLSPGDAPAGAEEPAVCEAANMRTCVPSCDEASHGYQLLATADGTGTKFSCSLVERIYSWQLEYGFSPTNTNPGGGYMGHDTATFLSAVLLRQVGVYVVILLADAGAGRRDLFVGPGQHVVISGDRGATLHWGSGFVVADRAVLALANVALPADALVDLLYRGGLSGVNCSVLLSGITTAGHPEFGVVTVTVSVAADGSVSFHPPNFVDRLPGFFYVSSGPCTVSADSRCVGRPDGYGPNEVCDIVVVGGGGVLGPSPIFDLVGGDQVITPDGHRHFNSPPPIGEVLRPGDTITWASDSAGQGGGNGGLPFSFDGVGGGWSICFG